MSELQVFNSEEFGRVRTIDINDTTYFAAKDRRLMDIADHGKDEVNKINAFKTARETTISQMKEIEENRSCLECVRAYLVW